jgi:hypothetical protein
MIWFNLHQQLTPEKLEAARDLWANNGPADYMLTYTIQRNQENLDHYLVKVRQGKAYEALVNGLAQAPDRMGYYGMVPLFDYMERFLEIDGKPEAPRTFTRASFDDNTGALREYVRRVTSKSERVAIIVEELETK